LVNTNDQLAFFDNVGNEIVSKTLTFNSSTWDTFQAITVRAIADGVVENFHKADLKLAVAGHPEFRPYKLTVDVGDTNYPGVRVIESNGSTTVAESTTQFGVSESSAASFPHTDTYTIALTQAPVDGVVTVTATAQPTRASQTGGIVSFS